MAQPLPKLALPVDPARDHIRGPEDAPVTLVAYGDYQCPYCRRLEPILARLREEEGDRYLYVFRHFPLATVHPHAQLAAEAAEAAAAQGKFWEMHEFLTVDSDPANLDQEALVWAAAQIGLDVGRFEHDLDEHVHAGRVREDFASGVHSGVRGTPAFFVDGARYDGPWDLESLRSAINKPLGTRIRRLFDEFARLEVSGGILLMIAAVVALVWANFPRWSALYSTLWETELAFRLGNLTFSHSLLHWVNDGLMAVFFFVVGLEIKREVLTGELSRPRQVILPLAAAIGGMLFPAAFYIAFNAGGRGAAGWGIPIATDIAFTLGVLALLGSRIPVALKVFFTALAIADDLGAVLVIALFYSHGIHLLPLAAAGLVLLALIALNRLRVGQPLPYALLGIGLWLAFLESGIHPTVAGVLLAMTIPARTQSDTSAFVAQSRAILRDFELAVPGGPLGSHGGRRQAAVQALETLAERLESPLLRLERALHPWTTYLILPIFALANAGVNLQGSLAGAVSSAVTIGIVVGLVFGKALGISLLSYLAVKSGLADLPEGINWMQLFSASWLAGIGFTMSLFIAGVEFTEPQLLASAKIGIIIASLLAGLIGTVALMLTTASYRRVSRARLDLGTE